ncbi:MAG: hypothetical protein ACI87W_003459 [Halieaceae bacterium]|jgi:hypothetical protein
MTQLSNSVLRLALVTGFVTVGLFLALRPSSPPQSSPGADQLALATRLISDPLLDDAQARYREVLKQGFSAGGHYTSVWIRDFNTFLVAASRLHGEHHAIRESLLTFLDFQFEDGHIVDGYVSSESALPDIRYITSAAQPELIAFTNTVESDQESSLVQAFAKYIQVTGDHSVLAEVRKGETVLTRLEAALSYLVDRRSDSKTGLLWGGTTADWGDVQPETSPGTILDENSHHAIDIYDNAMFILAMKGFLTLLPDDDDRRAQWERRLRTHEQRTKDLLWDDTLQKFRPHLYLEASPFAETIDESPIHFHGGTAVAAQAGLLDSAELDSTFEHLRSGIKRVGAETVGLTLSPAYPDGVFLNPIMGEHQYQNGGEWDWFGCRWVRALAMGGKITRAYESLRPILLRQLDRGLYEWFTIHGEARGAAPFKGSAGVCNEAIEDLRTWATVALSHDRISANLLANDRSSD